MNTTNTRGQLTLVQVSLAGISVMPPPRPLAKVTFVEVMKYIAGVTNE
jgi:hypothetical protein